MLGIRWRSGPTPVVIVAAQTGVTEGNAATQSPTYTPSSWMRAIAGARPEAIDALEHRGLHRVDDDEHELLGRAGHVIAR